MEKEFRMYSMPNDNKPESFWIEDTRTGKSVYCMSVSQYISAADPIECTKLHVMSLLCMANCRSVFRSDQHNEL